MKITTTIIFSFLFVLTGYTISDVDTNNRTKPDISRTQNDHIKPRTPVAKSVFTQKPHIKVPNSK